MESVFTHARLRLTFFYSVLVVLVCGDVFETSVQLTVCAMTTKKVSARKKTEFANKNCYNTERFVQCLFSYERFKLKVRSKKLWTSMIELADHVFDNLVN